MSSRLATLVAAVALVAAAGASHLAAAGPKETEQAASHYKQGIAFAEQKLFVQALEEYQAAYDLDPKPLLHYHMARAQQGAGHRQEAIDLYRAYVQEEPRGKGANDARKQIALLVKDLVDNPPAAEPPPTTIATPTAPDASTATDPATQTQLPPPHPDGQPLPPLPAAHDTHDTHDTHGRHTSWPLVGAGVAAIVVGVLVDTLPASSSNKKLDPLDFVPAAAYAGGATLVFVGVF